MSDDTAITLQADPSLPLEDVPEGWRLDSLSSLEWALEELAATQRQAAENVALMQQAHERLDLRLAAINRPLESRAQFLETAILEYTKSHRAELLTGKKKSREFPGGTVGFRKTGGKLTVTDEAACLAWAKEQPLEEGLYRVKVELSKSALNAHLKACGEVPPGCDLEEETEAAYVKPAADLPRLPAVPVPALPVESRKTLSAPAPKAKRIEVLVDGRDLNRDEESKP
jgi:phage host-nuclease inhibitor protein Gam